MFRPKAILFDFDGTLVDTSQAICECFNQVLRTHALPEFEYLRIRSLIGRPLVEMFQIAGFEGDPARFRGLVEEYRQHFLPVSLSLARILPGASELLHNGCKDAKIAVVTSRKADGALHILKGLGLSSHVELIIGIDEVSHPKPAPEPVLLALSRLSVNKNEAVMVGDTPDDVHAGKSAGVLSIAVLTGAHDAPTLRAAGADHVLRDLTELPFVLDLH